MQASRELEKAYLFLRTAHSAVSNLNIQIFSTEAHIQWNIMHGRHSMHGKYEQQLETEERDLKLWKVRLLAAHVGLVEWAACRAMRGRILPPEIVEMIKNMLTVPWYTC